MEYKFRGKRIDNGEFVYGFYRKYTFYNNLSDKPKEVYTKHFIGGFDNLVLFNGIFEQIDVMPETVGIFTGFKSEWFGWGTKTDEETEIYENQLIEVTFGSDLLPTMCYICMNRGRWVCQSFKAKLKYESLYRVLKHLDYCLHKDSSDKPTLNEPIQD